jgi:transcriptional regulator with XRE-family HTH domain
MGNLRFSENIIRLRRKMGITQDELAAFLRVTKASVSKWETKQSYPDILLLPQIAAYFDVSIDELLGYESQISPEQIMKCYQDLADDFAKLPFDEVVDKSRKLVKEYYSCYPLLMQMVILWINHFMLSPDKEKQTLLLNEAAMLCDRISDECSDVRLCSDAIVLKAMANLTLGNTKAVIEELEPLLEQKMFMFQSDSVLIQAYQMTGDISKADLHSQITIFTHILNLVCNSIQMITLHIQDKEFCETTICRIRQLIYVYDLEHLNPNTALNFHYQAAVFYCVYNEMEKALEELSQFVSGSLNFIDSDLKLHGDSYFNRIEEWFDRFAMKREVVRSRKVVLDSLIPAIENPVLAVLFETDKYRILKNKIERKRKEV